MAESIGALAVRIGGDASGLISELAKSKTALGKFGDSAKSAAKSAAQISGAVAAAGVAIFAFTKKAADTLDQLGKMSQKVGVSVESLSALKHAANLSDVSLEQLGVGLRQLSKNMADMQAGTGDARMAFQAMGLSVTDSQGKLKSTEEMLVEVAEKFSGMEDGAGKTAIAMRIFGKAGADLIPLLNQGKAGLAEARAEAERLGIVFSTQAAKDAEVFNDNLTRLSGMAQGLAIALAGPLVKALGETGTAFLGAQARSESFFRSLSEGFNVLVFGSDLTRMQRELKDAEESLVVAKKNLEGAKNRKGSIFEFFVGSTVEEAEAEVARLEANIKRMRAILADPFASPAAPADGKPKGKDAPAMENEAAKDKAAKDAATREQEVRDVLHRVQEENDKRDLDQVKFKIDEKERLENDARARATEQRERELQAAEDAAKREQEIREVHYKITQQQREREKAANQEFWNNLSGLMNTGSKKVFEIGKAFSLGQAAVKGAAAVMSAWEAGMSVGGPWAPLVAAAYAAAAGLNALNLMNNIRSQQFGGGGGAPVAPTQGASNVSPVGAGGAGQQQQRGPDTIINVRGEDMFSGAFLGKFAEKLNEFSRDGGRVLVSVS